MIADAMTIWQSTSRLLKKGSECFESLMLRQAQQNGKSSMISKPVRSS
jgi:hypothetical protein